MTIMAEILTAIRYLTSKKLLGLFVLGYEQFFGHEFIQKIWFIRFCFHTKNIKNHHLNWWKD